MVRRSQRSVSEGESLRRTSRGSRIRQRREPRIRHQDATCLGARKGRKPAKRRGTSRSELRRVDEPRRRSVGMPTRGRRPACQRGTEGRAKSANLEAGNGDQEREAEATRRRPSASIGRCEGEEKPTEGGRPMIITVQWAPTMAGRPQGRARDRERRRGRGQASSNPYRHGDRRKVHPRG